MKIYLCFLGGILTRPNPAKFRLSGLQWSRLMSQDENIRRVNKLNIQMLSKPLHRQLFKERNGNDDDEEAVKKSINHLKEHKLWGKKGSTFPDIDIKLPPVYGQNLEDHFRIIGSVQSQDYLDLAMQLIRTTLLPMPHKWSEREGWTKYDLETGESMSIPCPSDNALVLDVETCVSDSPRPILAVAASPHGWYSWVSKRLFSSQDYFNAQDTNFSDLIPLEVPGKTVATGMLTEARLVVGHNVCYDRARIKEQYLIKGTNTKFLDTLSLHVCVSGQTTSQKGVWLSQKKKERGNLEMGGHSSMDKIASSAESEARLSWMTVSSPNSLVEAHKLHAKNSKMRINKHLREVFVDGTIQDIRDNFQNLTMYCANDVFATYEILVQLLPLFLSRCPHPVTFAGMFEMGTPYLPLNSSWKQYTDDSESIYQEMQRDMKSKLITLANEACCYYHKKRYMNSPWLCNLDWTSKIFRGGKSTEKQSKQLIADLETFYLKEEDDMESDEGKETKYEFLISSFDTLSAKRPIHMPNYPEWYRSLCMKRVAEDWIPGPVCISAQTRVTPYLLRMKWNGHPLHHHPKLGWGYIVDPDLPAGTSPKPCENESQENWSVVDNPQETLEEMGLITQPDWDIDFDEHKMMLKKYWNAKKPISQDPVVKEANKCNWKEMGSEWVAPTEEGEEEVDQWMPVVVITPWGLTNDTVTLPNNEKYFFFRLPHKYGPRCNVGSPLSKDFLHKMEDGTLTSAAGHLGQRILKLNSSISFWRSSRKRVLNQFVVSVDDPSSPAQERSDPKFAIIPLIQPAGTVTRRAVDGTWLTASNAKEGRVGSELKTLVRAPPGYHIVGADVDSQELWIAAVLGDMHFTGIHGSTGIGWMLVQGNKGDATDVHSNTARTIGISRDDAKILNYGRIYGAGKPFIELLLKKFDPSLMGADLETKRDIIMNATKGRRVFNLNTEGQRLAHTLDIPLYKGNISPDDWKLVCSSLGYFRAIKLVNSRVWEGGTESHLFNELESIIKYPVPRTPVLGCCITQALETERIGRNFMTSRVNWVVQSSAVDYLHLMLVCTRWLFDKYEIDGRFCISIHDEVRYLVKSEDRYRASLALHFSNLFTRALFAYQMGMYDLPQSVAFFSAVDVDKVLRKEPKMDCVTPSNPLGLIKGHGIPLGETLDIYETLNKTNSSLKKPSPKKHQSSAKRTISTV